jgi:hypothetical protein
MLCKNEISRNTKQNRGKFYSYFRKFGRDRVQGANCNVKYEEKYLHYMRKCANTV